MNAHMHACCFCAQAPMPPPCNSLRHTSASVFQGLASCFRLGTFASHQRCSVISGAASSGARACYVSKTQCPQGPSKLVSEAIPQCCLRLAAGMPERLRELRHWQQGLACHGITVRNFLCAVQVHGERMLNLVGSRNGSPPCLRLRIGLL